MRDFARVCGPARVQGVASRDWVLASLALESFRQAELRNEAANFSIPKVKRRQRRVAEFGCGFQNLVDVARFRSNADLLMTFSTSAVAVCCCNAS